MKKTNLNVMMGDKIYNFTYLAELYQELEARGVNPDWMHYNEILNRGKAFGLIEFYNECNGITGKGVESTGKKCYLDAIRDAKNFLRIHPTEEQLLDAVGYNGREYLNLNYNY